jgi:hypothetical protein
MKFKFKILSMVVIGLSFLFSQQKVGRSGADFLSVSVLPEASCIGGAYVAMVKGAGSVFWNPAGLADVKNVEFFAGYTPWFIGTDMPAFAIARKYGNYGNFGFFMSGAFPPDMEVYDLDGPVIEDDGTIKSVSYSAYQIGFGYSRYYTDKFSAGIVFKYIRENYGGYSGTQSVALDAGTMFYTGLYTIRVGMAFLNLGPDLKPTGDYTLYVLEGGELKEEKREFKDYPLPTVFKIGIAFDPYVSKFLKVTTGIELSHPNDYLESLHIGTKFDFRNFYLGLGHRIFLGSKNIDVDEGGFSIGFGFNAPLRWGNIKFDYSFTDKGLLPDIHRFSISYIL